MDLNAYLSARSDALGAELIAEALERLEAAVGVTSVIDKRGDTARDQALR